MNCKSCGHAIPPVVQSAPYCPYCGEEHEEDEPAPAPTPFRGAQPSGPVFADGTSGVSPRELCLTFDPQIGFALIGSHRPRGDKPRLRAYDLFNKRVAWEALVGEQDLKDVDEEKLAVRGRNVYVSLGRILRVLDLFTGQPKWAAELSDKLEYDRDYTPLRGLRIADPLPPGRPGAVMAFLADYTVMSFDRDTGQPLWREMREHSVRSARTIEEAGLVVIERPMQLMNPFVQKPVATFDGRIERCDLEGRYGLWQVRDWGWRAREGIALHDYLANKEVLFKGVDSLEDDVQTVMGPGKVFAATESGAKLFGGPPGKTVELLAGFHIRALTMGGPTLFVLLEKTHGTDYRRILGVDPQTLAVRFDLGELTTEPDDDWTRQMCSNGQVTVIVTSPTNNDSDCELWGVDPGGRVLWKHAVGDWNGHYFLGGHVVVCSSRGWQVLRPDSGQPVAALAH